MQRPPRFLARLALVAAVAGLLAPAGVAAAGPAPARTAAGAGSEHQAGEAAAGMARRTLRNLPSSLLVTLRPGAALATVDEALAARGLARVAWNAALRTAQYVAVRGSAAGTLSVAGATTRARRLDATERTRLATLARDVRRIGGVVAAGPPIRLVPVNDPVAAPNDTYWASQWAPDAIGARTAWSVTRGRPEVVVAVIDTGVDRTHPDLASKLVAGTDLGDEDSDPTDEYGHGTHVAGIVAAASGNGTGVSGAAPGVFVMPIKVSTWIGADLYIDEQTVAEAILWAADHGARVVNLSLGAPHDDSSAVINAAIDDVRARGVVVVAAAGNDGPTGGVRQPAAYGPALAVAAVADRDPDGDADGDGVHLGCGEPRFGPGDFRLAVYSGTGPEVDLAAPGTCVLSTFPVDSGSAYAYLDGTSMATPSVAAAAALVLSRNPSLATDQVEAALLGTARDLGPEGWDEETGAGLVDAGAAVDSIAPPPSDGVAPVVGWTGITDGTVVRGTLAMSFTATDASPVIATRAYRDGAYLWIRRSAPMPISWASTGVADGLHSWTGHATDEGLKVAGQTVRVLVANHRATTTAVSSLTMTATARSIARTVRVTRSGAFVARLTGPSSTALVLRLVDSRGRTVTSASVRGSTAVAIAVGWLRAGTYTIRASASTARPGQRLIVRASWFR